MRTLIATLGSEAQVVTIAFDLLASRGRAAEHVVVLHTAAQDDTIRSALERLSQEMRAHPAYGCVRYSPILLRGPTGEPLADVDTPEGAAAAFRALYQAIRSAKRAEETRLPDYLEKITPSSVDVCLAGGRKTMSVYAMVAAQLLFDENDKLWHLVSAGALLQDKRMHPEPDDRVALIELPVLRYADVSPMYLDVAEADDPFDAVQRGEARLRMQRMAHARVFVVQELTDAERRTVGLLVREGLSDAEIAGRLFVGVRTVQTQLASAYRKAEAHFDLPRVTARALVGLLSGIANEAW